MIKTCKKRTYQNISTFLLYFFLRDLRALRGYNILYFEYIRYFFVNFFDRENVTLIYTIPLKVVTVEKREFLIVFYYEIRKYSYIKRGFYQKNRENKKILSTLYSQAIFFLLFTTRTASEISHPSKPSIITPRNARSQLLVFMNLPRFIIIEIVDMF